MWVTVSYMHSTRLFYCNTFLGKDRGCNMFCKSESTCKCFQVHTSERLLLWEFTAPSHVQREAGRGCFSTACEPGTADWLGSNCSQVRSAGGIYLSRVHSNRGRCTESACHNQEDIHGNWQKLPARLGLQLKLLQLQDFKFKLLLKGNCNLTTAVIPKSTCKSLTISYKLFLTS